jgi:DNA-binding NarL/FixJ family response regulator
MHTLTLEFPEEFADKLASMHMEGLTKAVQEAINTYVALGKDTITKLRNEAKKEDVPIASVIRQALIAPRLLQTKQNRQYLTERDAQIIHAIERGDRRTEVAAEHNLSLIRVHQIYGSYRARKKKDLADMKNANKSVKF